MMDQPVGVYKEIHRDRDQVGDGYGEKWNKDVTTKNMINQVKSEQCELLFLSNKTNPRFPDSHMVFVFFVRNKSDGKW